MKKRYVILVFLVMILVLLPVIAYFVTTSDVFLRRVVIPRALAHAELDGTVDSVSLKPFSALAIRGLALSKDGEFDLQLATVVVRYRLFSMLRSRQLLIDEIRIDGLDARIVAAAETPSPGPADRAEKPPKRPAVGDPLQLRIANLAVSNVNVVYLLSPDGEEAIRLSDFRLSVPLIANGVEASFDCAFGLTVSRPGVDLRVTNFSTAGTIGISPSLALESLNLRVAVAGLSGKAGGVDLAGRSLSGEAVVNLADRDVVIEKLYLRQEANGVVESRIEGRGRIASQLQLSRLDLLVDLPNAAILDLAGALAGDYTFGETAIKIDGQLAPNEDGDMGLRLSAMIGEATIASKKAGLIPGQPLNAKVGFAASLAAETGIATIETGYLGLSDDEEFLTVELSGPLAVPTREVDGFDPFAAGFASAATLRVKATRMDLAKIAGRLPPGFGLAGLAGLISAELDAAFVENGLAVRGLVDAKGVNPPTNAVVLPQPLDLALDWRGEWRRDNFIAIESFTASFAAAGETPAGVVHLSGGLDAGLTGRKSEIDLRFPETIDVGRLLALLPATDDEPAAPAEDSPPGRPPADARAASLPDNLWLAVTIAAPQVVHGEIEVKDIAMAAELRDQILRVSHAGLSLDGTVVGVRGEVDLTTLALKASLEATHLTAALKGAGLTPGQPLKLNARLAANLAMETGLVTIENGYLGLGDDEEFLTAELSGPLAVPTREVDGFDPFATGFASAATLRVKTTRMDLAEIAGRLPPGFGLAGLAGLISAELDAAFVENGLAVRGLVDAKGVNPPTNAVVLPQPLDLALDWRGEWRRDNFIAIESFTASFAAAGETPAGVVHLSGGLDAGLTGRKSEIDLRFPETIDVGRLLALLPATDDEPAAPAEDSPPGRPPADARAASLPDNLWLAVTIAAPQVVHGEIEAKDIAMAAELRNQILRVSKAGLSLDGSLVGARGEVDLTDMGTPGYTGAIDAEALPLAELVARFRPDFPLKFRGGVEKFRLDFSGRGTEAEMILPALVGGASFDVTEFQVVSMPDWAMYLTTEAMKMLNLGADDLRFHGGLAKLHVKDGRLEVLECRLDGALWRLAINGQIPFSGAPDLTFTPVFRGPSARKLAAEGVPLADGGDGFQTAPTLRLHGDVWTPVRTPLAIPRLLLDYSVALGKVPGEYRAVGQGLDVLRDIVKEPGEVGRDPAGTLRGILDIIEEVEGARRERKKPEEKAVDGQDGNDAKDEQDDKPAPADPIDNLLRGIFGR